MLDWPVFTWYASHFPSGEKAERPDALFFEDSKTRCSLRSPSSVSIQMSLLILAVMDLPSGNAASAKIGALSVFPDVSFSGEPLPSARCQKRLELPSRSDVKIILCPSCVH